MSGERLIGVAVVVLADRIEQSDRILAGHQVVVADAGLRIVRVQQIAAKIVQHTITAYKRERCASRQKDVEFRHKRVLQRLARSSQYRLPLPEFRPKS